MRAASYITALTGLANSGSLSINPVNSRQYCDYARSAYMFPAKFSIGVVRVSSAG